MSIVTSAARLSTLQGLGRENEPFVAWDNIGANATLGGTTTLADGDRANALTGTTYDYWLPNVTATTARIDFGFLSPRSLSCCAIAAHNLATLGASVQIRRSTDGGVSYSDAGAGIVTPTDNSPIIFRMPANSNDAADWQVFFTGLVAGDPLAVGVIFMGNESLIPTRVFSGYSPVVSPTEVALQSNVSVGGNLLGSSVISTGSRIAAQFNHVSQAYARGGLKNFMPHFNAGKGFFFAWRPTEYPDDAHYCWRDGEALRFTNMGALDLVQFSMQMRAYEG